MIIPDKLQAVIADGTGEKIESIAVEQRILKDLDAPFVKPLTASPALKHLVVPKINSIVVFSFSF